MEEAGFNNLWHVIISLLVIGLPCHVSPKNAIASVLIATILLTRYQVCICEA